MKVRIKRIDKTLPLPVYQTTGAAAFDLYARTDTVVEPQSLAYIPTNLIIESPQNHVLILASRSSSPKKGLLIPHGIGVIDSDYCGDSDEILFQVLNFTDAPVTIQRGDRIGQGMFVRLSRALSWDEQESMDKKSRGGFGSTGTA
ncbi:MAG: dUTP diphosphatase [Candidatus Niyogibacteria bacterium CG10_big_fil_rev_8_21_14_0_10_46_36]|uniref:dUTP diphosphatase n=1 Tax=Candidatus Niyogibacteria bacterium CG10_big_fil_rev_8_21_14_0_10_46_36 TaxID=1974726 RepID=A0A2H0TEN3_9BACT|nr:MAG: dUTP diphosphatase [Candidatus Niyogibacteria bacterium CG10_big_fil_rev_8_21_14_0_10_46_36]